MQRPRVADFTEDYTLIGMRKNPGSGTASAFCDEHALTIARILRPAAGAPSAEEVRAATEVRIAFGPDFANVQLLEMRWLDLQLDTAIERSYHLLGRPQGILSAGGGPVPAG